MPTICINDIDLYYELYGDGEPLVLIAGLGYGLWQWHAMIPFLAERKQVIAFDNRGAGQTAKPAGPYSAAMMAEDTARLIEEVIGGPAAVMGHSMGGFIAQQLVLSRPDLVSKLILASTNFGGPNAAPVAPEALTLLLDRSGDPADIVRRGVTAATAPGFTDLYPEALTELLNYRFSNPVPPDAYAAQLAVGLGLLSPEAAFDGKLSAVQVPTLILFGEHDRVVPPANAQLLAAQIPQSQVAILPGAGHIFPIETPAEAARAVLEFLG